MLELLDIDHISDAEIISLCHSTTANLISDPESSVIVARLSPDIAVKFSYFMTIGEFHNMQIAYQRLDPSIVRVPRPYRFIKTEAAVVPEEPDDDLQSSSDGSSVSEADYSGYGYLVMEFVEGEQLNDESATAWIPQLARVVSHMHELHGEVPGSLGGEPVRGHLWWDDHTNITFKDRPHLERWLTRRLSPTRPNVKIQFNDQPLVLCHMDLAPRNILVKDGVIALLDWTTAAYLPRLFEHVAPRLAQRDIFFWILRPQLEALTTEEQKLVDYVAEALSNCIQFAFSVEADS